LLLALKLCREKNIARAVAHLLLNYLKSIPLSQTLEGNGKLFEIARVKKKVLSIFTFFDKTEAP